MRINTNCEKCGAALKKVAEWPGMLFAKCINKQCDFTMEGAEGSPFWRRIVILHPGVRLKK